MSQVLIFNHHSLPFASISQAEKHIPDFIRICLKSQNLGFNMVVLSQEEVQSKDLFRIQLTQNYYWQDWYNQYQNTDKDLARAFRSIQSRGESFKSDSSVFTAYIKESKEQFSSVNASIELQSPITSFPTRSPWDNSPIPVIVEEIKDSTCEIHTSNEEIINFYSLKIVENFQQELEKSIQSGKELFEKKGSLYPHIDFCGKSLEQLYCWSQNITLLNQVRESIVILNKFAEKWQNGEIHDYSHKALRDCGLNHDVSDESSSTLQNPRLRQEREYWLPSGRKEIFEKHIKLAQGNRIHFFPDNQTKTFFIGYIGQHLKTE